MALSQSSTRMATGCLVLFSLPFIGMGTFFAVLSYRSLNNPNFKNPWIGVIMGSFFALIGLALMFSGFAAGRKQRALRAVEASYPDQPWMWRPDWAQGRAQGLGGSSAAGAWVFATIWNFVSWLSAWAMSTHPDPRRPIWLGLIVGLFCAIGVGALLMAVVQTLRFARFGKTSLALQTIPAPLGRKLKGTIDVRLPSPLPHGINLVFSCVNRVTSGTGDSRSTTDHIRWQEKKSLGAGEIMGGPTGSTIPVEFDVPRDMPATNHDNNDNQMLWLLRAEADVPGVDFDERYEVPVFETRESPALSEWQAHQDSEERAHPATTPTRPTVQVSTAQEGGTQFYFPAGRNVSVALWLTVFTAIFGGVSYALLFQMHAPIFFGVIFSFFSVLLLFITVNLWFGTATIIAGSSGLKFSTNLLGFGGSKQWTPQQIQRIYPKITMQSGGADGVAYYTVTLTDATGRDRQLGNALRDHNEAEWVCEQLRNLVGLSAKSVSAS